MIAAAASGNCAIAHVRLSWQIDRVLYSASFALYTHTIYTSVYGIYSIHIAEHLPFRALGFNVHKESELKLTP